MPVAIRAAGIAAIISTRGVIRAVGVISRAEIRAEYLRAEIPQPLAIQ